MSLIQKSFACWMMLLLLRRFYFFCEERKMFFRPADLTHLRHSFKATMSIITTMGFQTNQWLWAVASIIVFVSFSPYYGEPRDSYEGQCCWRSGQSQGKHYHHCNTGKKGGGREGGAGRHSGGCCRDPRTCRFNTTTTRHEGKASFWSVPCQQSHF